MLHFAEPRYSAFKRFAILAKPCRRADSFRPRIDMERGPRGAPRRGELPEYTRFSTLDTRYDED